MINVDSTGLSARPHPENMSYFNPTRNGKTGAVKDVEAWQILSPLRGMPFGVGDINRQIMSTSDRALWSWHPDTRIVPFPSRSAQNASSMGTRS